MINSNAAFMDMLTKTCSNRLGYNVRVTVIPLEDSKKTANTLPALEDF